MKLPILISFEGIDTTGKTTLVEALAHQLAALGRGVALKYESPLDEDVAERIDDALKKSIFISEGFGKGPQAALLFMLYAECLASQQVRRDAHVVLADRSIDSIAVYQGAALQLDDSVDAARLLDAIETLYLMIGGRVPDLTILLIISNDELQRRFNERHGRMPADAEFTELIRLQERFKYIASMRARYVMFDADMSNQELQTTVMRNIKEKFDLRATL